MPGEVIITVVREPWRGAGVMWKAIVGLRESESMWCVTDEGPWHAIWMALQPFSVVPEEKRQRLLRERVW